VLTQLQNLESIVTSSGANFGTKLLYSKFEPYCDYIQRCDSYFTFSHNLVITVYTLLILTK